MSDFSKQKNVHLHQICSFMNYFRSHFDDCFWKSSFLLFLEDACHSQVGIGYEIFGHFRVADDIIKSVDELVTDAAAKKVTVVLGAQKVKHCEASEFREECTKYFERYYKTLAKKAPLVLHHQSYQRN